MGTAVVTPFNAPAKNDGTLRHTHDMPAFVANTPKDLSFVQTPAHLLIECDRPGYFRDGAPFKWKSIDDPLDGADCQATIGIDALDVEKLATEHFSHLLDKFRGDRRIRIVQGTIGSRGLRGDVQYIFQGFPQVESVTWGPNRQSMSLTCLSEAQEKLRTGMAHKIAGRYMRSRPDQTWSNDSPDHRLVTALPAVFNPNGMPNRLASSAYFVDTGSALETLPAIPISLWTADNDSAAEYWTYVQALRTVAYLWVLATPNVPVSVREFLSDTETLQTDPPAEGDPQRLDPFIARLMCKVEGISVQSMNVDEAFAVLCSAARLHYHYRLHTVSVKTTPGDEPPAQLPRSTAQPEYYLRIFAPIQQPEEQEQTPGEITRTMIPPTVHDIPRDKPFRDYTGASTRTKIEANRASHAQLTIDRRAINAPWYVGGHVEYEVSLLLRPGWPPHSYLDNITTQAGQGAARDYWFDEFFTSSEFDLNRIPNSVYHSEHPNHLPYADVFRLWVFPDDPTLVNPTQLYRDSGAWTVLRYHTYQYLDDDGQPLESPILMYAHPTWGGGLAPIVVNQWVPRRRPFYDTIARRNLMTTDRAPIVRVHFGVRDANGNYTTNVPEPDDDDWVEFVGDVRILEDRAAIRFNEGNILNAPCFCENPDDPWGDSLGLGLAMLNYAAGHFWVQVTCTVRDDRRMEHGISWPGSSAIREQCELYDLGYQRFRKRLRRQSFDPNAGNSYLQTFAADDAEYEDRDDTTALAAFAAREKSRILYDSISGSLEIFYLDPTYLPGDSFDGCQGLGIKFNKFAPIERVRHINDKAGQRTQLMLTDLRENPEVGT